MSRSLKALVPVILGSLFVLAPAADAQTRHADCSGWVVSHTDVSGGITAAKSSGLSWPTKAAACGWAKTRLKRATLDENGGRIPGWRCSSAYGAATCKRHGVTIVFVWQ